MQCESRECKAEAVSIRKNRQPSLLPPFRITCDIHTRPSGFLGARLIDSPKGKEWLAEMIADRIANG